MGKKSRQIEGQLELFFSTDHFNECVKCWCRDCKHNLRNEAVPRDICGKKIPCPACEGCLSEGTAEICEIGSAKNGCKTRAEEEGIIIS